MPVIRNILVPTDFSETSRAALRYAKDLAQRFNSRIHLVHVVPEPIRHTWAIEPGLAVYADDFEERLEQAHAGLCAMATEAGLDPLYTTVRAVDGSTLYEITQYVRRQGIDLIVMGTHGHGAVVHLLVGSVAERVVRHAPCPVLVVPGTQRADVLARDSADEPTVATAM
jgi:nucleotide-binding universal stress UspA family protein